MKPEEVRLQKKLTALNKIRKIYHPLTKNHYDRYSGDSYREQESWWVLEIIEELEKELKK
jgi:hypothetical protein